MKKVEVYLEAGELVLKDAEGNKYALEYDQYGNGSEWNELSVVQLEEDDN